MPLRNVLLAGLIAAWPLLVGAANRRPLAAFEFKGYTAGQAVSADNEECINGDQNLCTAKSDDVIAGHRVNLIVISLNNHMISSVTIMADSIEFSLIEHAFKEKYGQPCSERIETWRNLMGTSVPNPVFVWCFRTGKLTAKLHGASYDSASIEYEDQNRMPPDRAKPKIDF